MTADPVPTSPVAEGGGQVTIMLDRKKVSVARVANETLLESARRGSNARKSCNWRRKPPNLAMANPEDRLRRFAVADP